MKVICIANVKGGCGKSTTAAILGYGLSEKGYNVLMIDSDPQCNLTMCYEDEPEDGTPSLYNVYAEKKSLEDVKHPIRIGLDLVACDFELSTADVSFTGVSSFKMLDKALKNLQAGYDYVIVDLPPNMGILSYNAFMASDYVIVPAAADRFSSKGTRLLKRIIDEVNEERQEPIKVLGVLLTRYTDRTNVSKAMEKPIQTAAGMLDTGVFNSRIRQAVIVQESQTAKVILQEYAPKAPVTEDYRNFVNEFLEKVGNE